MANTSIVHPSTAELFSSRHILLELNYSSFPDGKTWNGSAYTKFQSTAVVMGLYANWNEFDKGFDETVRAHVTPANRRVTLVHLYQTGAPVLGIYKKHEFYVFFDIQESAKRGKHTKLQRCLSRFLIGMEPVFGKSINFSRSTPMPLQRVMRNTREKWLTAKYCRFQKE